MPINNQYQEQFQEVLKRLNTAQRHAVEKIEGPVLVVAGPGTGKTQILSARIGNILAQTDASAHNILCLTYTDAGTVAMRKRLVEFIGPEAYNVHVYTFHAFCNDVIQSNLDFFGIRNLQPISDLEQVELLQSLIDSFAEDHPLRRLTGNRYYEGTRLSALFDVMKKEGWTPDFMNQRIEEYLESLPDRETYQYKKAYTDRKTGVKYQKGDVKEKSLAEEQRKMSELRAAVEEFDHYQSLMKEAGRYDYNDMLLWVMKAFQENEEILLNYQEQYHYFLVDEFQDTNGIQNQLLAKLSDYWEEPNVFVVGDDDQSIFRFQGANIQNISDFHQSHISSIETVVLDQNYRSSQHILDASKVVIDNNKERLVSIIEGLNKDLTAAGSEANTPDLPRLIEFHNESHEEVFVLEELERLHKEGVPLQEVAVIYRGHAQVANLVKMLEDKNIPLNIKQRVNILDLPIIQNILTIIRYLQVEFEKPASGEHLLFELMHYRFFNIEPQDIAKISLACHRRVDGEKLVWRDLMSDGKKLLELNIESTSSITSLAANLSFWTTEMANMTLQVLFEKILTKGQVLEHIMHSKDRNWLIQVITTFFNFIKDESAKNPKISVAEFLAMIDRMDENKITINLNKVLHAEKGVNFVTSHSSKGLEFDHVYVMGCTSDKWEGKRQPNFGYKIPDTITPGVVENLEEEERRLFYVAMTRAKRYLTITYAGQKDTGKAIEASKFVVELVEGSGLHVDHRSLSDETMVNYYSGLMLSQERIGAELIDHDLADKVLERFKMSVTSLNKYLRCPLSFYFENIVRVPTARNVHMGFGSAVHYALEIFFNEMLKSEQQEFPSSDELLSLFEHGMNIYRSHFTDVEYDDRLAYARQILPAYYEQYIGTWNKKAVLEYDVSNAVVGGVPISGKLDKLEFTGEQVTVVDYKTGNPDKGRAKLKGPSDKNPLGDDYWRQLVFYKILMDNDTRKPWVMISGEMDFVQKSTSKDEFIKEKLVIRPEDVELVSNQITNAYASMRQHHFDGCGEDDCQWCRFVQNNFKSTDLDLAEQES